MQREEMNRLLEPFDLPLGGRDAQKRARIRIYFGLRKVPGAEPA